MAYNEVTSGSSNNPVFTGLFAGTSSALCQSTFTIEEEGFGLLPSASTPDQCGSTANSLRVQETNNGPSSAGWVPARTRNVRAGTWSSSQHGRAVSACARHGCEQSWSGPGDSHLAITTVAETYAGLSH